MIYLSRYCKIKPQHTAPLIVSDIKKLLAPLPNRYTRGEYSVPVNTTAEQYSDEYRRFWRYHGHFTLEFTRAIIESLPKDVEFVSYDHLNNKLTLIKL
jgi:hypothetical protein|tara:strand:- start:509 stop:802 length:294 start_codon:yes stop_codon:yes gene_type:complete